MAQPTDSDRLPHDPAFKAIFSHPRMIADALRGYAVQPGGPLHPRTVAALDFDTLEKLPAEWITRGFRRRIGDQAWRVRFRWGTDWADPGGYLLILVEFQSGRDADMALRMASYAAALYAELETAGVVRAGGPRPPIFPLLIHNGPSRWTASTALDKLIAQPAPPAIANASPQDIEDARQAARDLAAFQLQHAYWPLDFHPHREDDAHAGNAMSVMIGLESASTPGGLLPPLQVLRELAQRPLAEWMLVWTLRRMGVDDETAEEMRRMASLDEFRSQLEERARGWTEQWFAQGREEGIEQGRAEGMEQGIQRARAEGVAAQRAALRRQAALRFGAAAERLDPFLARVNSLAKLAEISVWVMTDTLDELAAKVEAATTDSHAH